MFWKTIYQSAVILIIKQIYKKKKIEISKKYHRM